MILRYAISIGFQHEIQAICFEYFPESRATNLHWGHLGVFAAWKPINFKQFNVGKYSSHNGAYGLPTKRSFLVPYCLVLESSIWTVEPWDVSVCSIFFGGKQHVFLFRLMSWWKTFTLTCNTSVALCISPKFNVDTQHDAKNLKPGITCSKTISFLDIFGIYSWNKCWAAFCCPAKTPGLRCLQNVKNMHPNGGLMVIHHGRN